MWIRMIWICSLALALALGAGAQARRDHESVRQLTEAGEILPLEIILEKARNHLSGRILEVELEDERGRYIYELEMLDDEGSVWELELDATTGGMIEMKRDD